MGVEKAVILAAGRGSRMRQPDPGAPLSPAEAAAADSGFKALMPVGGRPFLDYVLAALAAAGLREVCLVVAPGQRPILEASVNLSRHAIRVAFAVQTDASGTADAVLAAEAFVAGGDFLVLNADNYYPVSALRALRDLDGPGLPVFDRESLVRQSNIPRDRVSRYAILRVGDDGVLERIVEKPDAASIEGSGGPVLVSMNLWRFSPAIFDACRRVGVSSRGERELPEAVQFAISQRHERFRAVRCEDGVLDLSTRSDVARVAQRLGPRENAVSALQERLVAEGLHPSEARRKRELFAEVDAALRALRGDSDEGARRWFVPGRVEVLGKHTDYAGGRSLVCAIGRGFCVAAAPRADAIVRIVDVARNLEAELALGGDPGLSPTGWKVYAQTVANRIAQNFAGPLRGADIVLASDLPRASGLSSSSALVVALFTALSEINALETRSEYAANIRGSEDLGGYLGALENGLVFGTLSGDRGVGTFGGSEDQTAILSCRAGQIAQYSFCPVRRERSIALEPDWSFVVGSSGIPADKTGNARQLYNRLSLAAAAILDLWNRSAGRSDPNLFAAATGSPDAVERIQSLLRVLPVPDFSPEFLLGRFEQFVEESTAIIPTVGDLLVRGEVLLTGPHVDRSQELAERCLGNQVPETVMLAQSARQLGAAAASAFGAGFGGSVWALVRTEEAEGFRKRWAESYAEAFPNPTERSRFFTTRPGPAVVRL